MKPLVLAFLKHERFWFHLGMTVLDHLIRCGQIRVLNFLFAESIGKESMSQILRKSFGVRYLVKVFNVFTCTTNVLTSKLLGTFQNGSISRASTQVPVKGVFDILGCALGLIFELRVQAHDNAGGAVSTLRSMSIC
jgi:hypothetical protein